MGFRAGLFILMLMVGVTSFAREDDCFPNSHSPDRARKESCDVRCEIYYQKNPSSRPADKKHTCEDLGEWVDRVFRPYPTIQDKLKMQEACGKGIIAALENVPVKMRLYLATIQKFGDWVKAGIQEHQQFMEECRKDIACKREIARFMVQYRQKNADGSFVLSDAQVDQQIQNQDFLQLAMSVQEQRGQMQRTCATQLSVINRKLQPAGGDWNYELLAKRYDELQKWDPYCPIALKFNRPTPDSVDAESTKNFEFWDDLKTKIQCQSPEKNKEGFCGGITELIADPANLIPAAGGVAIKAGNALARRETAKFLEHAATSRAGTAVARTSTSGIDGAATSTTAKVVANDNVPLSVSTGQKKLPHLGDEKGVRQLKSDYSQAKIVHPDSNRKFAEMARTKKASDNTIFVSLQNWVQKKLNTITDDFALVDAINNRYYESILSRVRKLAEKNPEIKITEGLEFKSLELAIEGNPSKQFMSELDQIFKQANQQAAAELKSLGLMPEGKTAEEWFKAGYGKTYDQADQTARAARSLSGENKLWSFDDVAIQQNGKDYVHMAESLRSEAQRELKDTGLLEVQGTQGEMIPKREVWELLRKNTDPEQLRSAIQNDLQVQVTRDQAAGLLNYNDMVNQFSPSVLTGERRAATLSNTTHGGVAMDFAGMGAENLHETAKQLIKKESYQDAIDSARVGEQNVTKSFNKRFDDVEKKANEYLSKKKQLGEVRVVRSGDDVYLSVPNSLSAKNREELVQLLSKSDRPGGVRVSFVNKTVSAAEKDMVASHGHSIEKALRVELRGQISRETLQNVTFALDMQGSAAGEGPVKLLMGNSRVPITPADRKKIEAAFQRALNSENTRTKSKYQITP